MTTINLDRGPRGAAATMLGISAAAPGGVRATSDGTRPDPIGWLLGHYRVAGRHRPARRRRAAFAQVVKAAAGRVRSMVSTAGDVVLHVGAMACFTVGAFAYSTVAGWLVAGLALIWTQHVRE